jgi:Peptidase M10 serralysin C terminal
MATSAEIQLLRNADPGAVLPGIDTPEGNQLALSSLKPLSSITTNHSALFWYDPTVNVVRAKTGAVLNGYNFGSATVEIEGNNVTVENSTFNNTSGYLSLQQDRKYSGAIVINDTFIGSATSHAGFITSTNNITVSKDSFVGASGDAVDLGGGTVSYNYFGGGGVSGSAHSDAIWVTNNSSPVTINNNLIDWTSNVTSGSGSANNAIRITTELGPVNNVTVRNNFLLGGGDTIDAGNKGTHGTFSNINIDNNYVGFGLYGAFYPGAQSGVAKSGNVVFDYTSPIYSTQAWAAYQATGIPTANVVTARSANLNIASLPSGSTTLHGDGLKAHMGGRNGETNFVGGAGGQYVIGGGGANIFTYLAFSDSGCGHDDGIANFDPAKDVIDLSHIDANPSTAGVQNFTFIGTAPFSGAGGEVRYWQDPAKNRTYIEADPVGGQTPDDLQIQIAGLQTLTAANFALTAAQSKADMTAGAALGVSETRVGAGGEYFYTNVPRPNYSSYQAFYINAATRVADELNLNSGADELDLYGGNLTISRGGGTESLLAGTLGFSLGYHSNETIQAAAAGSETFAFGSRFGNETINGFAASGTNADTIQFATSAFSYLNAGMTQAADLAAVLRNATSSSFGITIGDSAGDRLTLTGVTASTIMADSSHFHFGSRS